MLTLTFINYRCHKKSEQKNPVLIFDNYYITQLVVQGEKTIFFSLSIKNYVFQKFIIPQPNINGKYAAIILLSSAVGLGVRERIKNFSSTELHGLFMVFAATISTTLPLHSVVPKKIKMSSQHLADRPICGPSWLTDSPVWQPGSKQPTAPSTFQQRPGIQAHKRCSMTVCTSRTKKAESYIWEGPLTISLTFEEMTNNIRCICEGWLVEKHLH